MTKELLSGDRLTRARWPVLFWLNRATLIGAGGGLATVIGVLIYESTQSSQALDRPGLDGVAGAAYVVTAFFGVAFMVTGYVRLLLVHRDPEHVPWPTPARPRGGLVQRLVGAIALFAAIAAGWIHWGIGTAILFLVVFAVVYLPVVWR